MRFSGTCDFWWSINCYSKHGSIHSSCDSVIQHISSRAQSIQMLFRDFVSLPRGRAVTRQALRHTAKENFQSSGVSNRREIRSTMQWWRIADKFDCIVEWLSVNWWCRCVTKTSIVAEENLSFILFVWQNFFSLSSTTPYSNVLFLAYHED